MNGRFVAVGSNADIRNLVQRTTRSWDAQQATIVPGFIDTHNHATGTTLLYEALFRSREVGKSELHSWLGGALCNIPSPMLPLVCETGSRLFDQLPLRCERVHDNQRDKVNRPGYNE